MWRQRGQVVGTSDLQSGGPGFESRSGHLLDLYSVCPEFKSSATNVNSQLDASCQLGFLMLLGSNLRSGAPDRKLVMFCLDNVFLII